MEKCAFYWQVEILFSSAKTNFHHKAETFSTKTLFPIHYPKTYTQNCEIRHIKIMFRTVVNVTLNILNAPMMLGYFRASSPVSIISAEPCTIDIT